MQDIRLGVIMNGVTGRMGQRQHLARSVVAIRDAGGIVLADGRRLVPDPVLVGRNEEKLTALALQHRIPRWTTDLDTALADPTNLIYFDALSTPHRFEHASRAIAAGKHIYCEQPTSTSLSDAVELARLANVAGVKNGVVSAKLFVPGIRKLRRLVDAGFFGRILNVRLDFGYWSFEGDWHRTNRPSWTSRSGDGGGLVLDMYPHWNYVFDAIVGPVRAVLCHTATHIPRRWDEAGRAYEPDVEDAAYGLLSFDGGATAQVTTSWATRLHRDEIAEWHVDGTLGSAVAGLRECRTQSRVNSPMPVWDPDVPNTVDFRGAWSPVPDNEVFGNAFRTQWELFLRHVAAGETFPWGLYEGAKGIALAELAEQSARERRWIDVPDLA